MDFSAKGYRRTSIHAALEILEVCQAYPCLDWSPSCYIKEDWALVSPRVVLARLTVPQSSCRTRIKCHYDNQLKANDSEVRMHTDTYIRYVLDFLGLIGGSIMNFVGIVAMLPTICKRDAPRIPKSASRVHGSLQLREMSRRLAFQKYMYVIGHLQLRALTNGAGLGHMSSLCEALKVNYPCFIGSNNFYIFTSLFILV